MTDERNPDREWIPIEQTRDYRERVAREPDPEKRREQLLKNELLERRIAATAIATKQREQKLADERDAIAADAIADLDREHHERIEDIHERAHALIARAFMFGVAGLIAFCTLPIVVFVIIIAIGILLALIGYPLP